MTGIGRAGRDLIAGLPLLLAVAWATRRLSGLPAAYVLQAVALYALLAALVVRAAPAVLPGAGLGAANRVTLGRATLVLPVAALALHAGRLDAPAWWWIVAVSTAALILDGFDGWAARRTGGATAFGARFDMELDAFLMLALSALVWLGGRAGAWVLLIGALRYLFVAAGRLRPALRAPLPPSRRRKVVCVVEGAVLVSCLAPVMPASAAGPVAAVALALLIYSFAVDVRWLLRHAGRQPAAVRRAAHRVPPRAARKRQIAP